MPYNILIVDDSSCMRKVLRKTITMCGIGDVSFYEAENGAVALKLIHDEWIDLIFTDINMPVMNGLELVQNLRSDDSIKNTPIIVVTSDTNVESTEEVKTHNIKDIIYKPFRPEAVRMLLINLLGLEDNQNEDDSNFGGLDF